MFGVVDVSTWPVTDEEPAGGEEKAWLRGDDGEAWLWKPRTDHDTWSQGEDWAERIVSAVAGLLAVPAAHVELARRGTRHGSISHNFRRDGWELHHGSILITAADPSALPDEGDRRGHSLAMIADVLATCASVSQPGRPGTAWPMFAAFLLLDALVANQDRHAENWAVLTSAEAITQLAPSFDHGSSLGFNLTDEERIRRLDADGVPAWAARGRAQRFERDTDGRRSLVDLAVHALRASGQEASTRASLLAVSDSDLLATVEQVPEMSDAARTFTGTLLVTNRRRLLDEL